MKVKILARVSSVKKVINYNFIKIANLIGKNEIDSCNSKLNRKKIMNKTLNRV